MSSNDITNDDIREVVNYAMGQLSLSVFMSAFTLYCRGLERHTVANELLPATLPQSELLGRQLSNEYKKRPRSKGVPKNLKSKLFKRDHYTCQICGRRYPEEHLVPNHMDHNSRNNKMINLETTCAGCNMQEGRIYAELLRKAGPRSEITEERRLELVGEARSLAKKTAPRSGWRKML